MHMHEEVGRQATHGVHRHRREDAVAQLHQHDGHNADGAHQQREVNRGGPHLFPRARATLRKRVRRPFESIWRRGVEQFADDEKRKNRGDPKLEIPPAAWPDVGPQTPYRLEKRRFRQLLICSGLGRGVFRIERVGFVARFDLIRFKHSAPNEWAAVTAFCVIYDL
ncbi:MAG: hypothetical protein FD172_3356 [Methylocystaceae bacterium]|nr:MAG: hypothetical protein FD172_3356 [Methylocystaceae bacterium]